VNAVGDVKSRDGNADVLFCALMPGRRLGQDVYDKALFRCKCLGPFSI